MKRSPCKAARVIPMILSDSDTLLGTGVMPTDGLRACTRDLAVRHAFNVLPRCVITHALA